MKVNKNNPIISAKVMNDLNKIHDKLLTKYNPYKSNYLSEVIRIVCSPQSWDSKKFIENENLAEYILCKIKDKKTNFNDLITEFKKLDYEKQKKTFDILNLAYKRLCIMNKQNVAEVSNFRKTLLKYSPGDPLEKVKIRKKVKGKIVEREIVRGNEIYERYGSFLQWSYETLDYLNKTSQYCQIADDKLPLFKPMSKN